MIRSEGLWPPRSPGMNPQIEFYVWGMLRDNMYTTNNNPGIEDVLNESIQDILRKLDTLEISFRPHLTRKKL